MEDSFADLEPVGGRSEPWAGIATNYEDCSSETFEAEKKSDLRQSMLITTSLRFTKILKVLLFQASTLCGAEKLGASEGFTSSHLRNT